MTTEISNMKISRSTVLQYTFTFCLHEADVGDESE